MANPASVVLSQSQLATLAEQARSAAHSPASSSTRSASEYPFIAIREGEVAIVDAAGNEIVRHGACGFLGEMNLLSGQTVFVTAVVTQPTRYIAVERGVLRSLLFEDGPLADLLLSAFMRGARRWRRSRASGSRSSARARRRPTRRIVDSRAATGCR